jgi:hypothetical protein
VTIWLDGSWAVPSPCLTSDNTTDIRTKQVVMRSTAGARLTTPNIKAAESVASSERLPTSERTSPPTASTSEPVPVAAAGDAIGA